MNLGPRDTFLSRHTLVRREEYERYLTDPHYRKQVRSLFSSSRVLFIARALKVSLQVQERSAGLCYDRIVHLLEELRKRSNDEPKTLEAWLRDQLREYGLSSGMMLW